MWMPGFVPRSLLFGFSPPQQQQLLSSLASCLQPIQRTISSSAATAARNSRDASSLPSPTAVPLTLPTPGHSQITETALPASAAAATPSSTSHVITPISPCRPAAAAPGSARDHSRAGCSWAAASCSFRAPSATALPAHSIASRQYSKVTIMEDVIMAREKAKAKAGGKNRFYRTVQVREAPGEAGPGPGRGFSLYLGKYPIKTPARHVLVLPTMELALAIAAEWEWQDSSKPAVYSMPLMSLTATAIDQPKSRAKVIDTLTRFIHTDSALCRCEPGPMAVRQSQVFDPLISWAQSSLGWTSLHVSDSIFGTQQDPAVLGPLHQLLQGLDPWHLAALEQLTQCGKSVLLGLALLEGRMSLADGIAAARLEELFQCEEWGEVEAGHDLDRVDISSRMAAAVLLVRLLNAK